MFIDISYPLDKNTVIYPNDPMFFIENAPEIENDGFRVSKISFGSHFSTHIDAPSHFIKGGKDINQLDINKFGGKAKVIEVRYKAITKEFLEKCDIEKDDIIIFKANHKFDGTRQLEDYVGLENCGAKYLVDKKIKMVGIDYINIEPENSTDNLTHKVLLESQIPILETLDLRQVQCGEYELFAFPLAIENSDASPVRAVLKIH